MTKKYYELNKKHILRKQHKNYILNKNKILDRNKKYRKSNSIKIKIQKHKYWLRTRI